MITLNTFFDRVFDLFRNNEKKTGEEVLKIIIYYITYFKLQEHITDKDIEDMNEMIKDEESDDLEDIKGEWMRFNTFYDFATEDKDVNGSDKKVDISPKIDIVFDFCFKNSRFSKAFDDYEKHKIFYSSTVIQILNMLRDVDFDSVNVDILGDMYEELVKTQFNGNRGFGQFFTPSETRKEMIEMIKPKEGELIYDFAMGSGGFLLTAYEYLKSQGVSHDNIIKCLSGCEIQNKIYSLCCSNLLMVTGDLPKKLYCEDSFMFTKNKGKYDVILANPPFGIKMNKMILTQIHEDFIPHKSNDSVMNFIQVAISLLKVGGRCAIVIPSGQQLTSTNKTFLNVRKYLFHTCKVISMKKNVHKFKTTAVDTSILYFVKVYDKEQENIVKTIVDFDNVEVGASFIKRNSYSLGENTYLEEEIQEKEGYKTYNLGDIIEFLSDGKRNSKDGIEIMNEEYKYPLYFCSILKHLWLNQYDYEDEEAIMINKTNGSGKCELFYDRYKYSVAQTTLRFRSKIDGIKTKYLFYYLKSNKDKLEQYYTGTNQKSIRKDDFNSVQIQIPNIEVQEEFIRTYDELIENIKKLQNSSNELLLSLKK